jgi:hypothetical protein
MVRVSFKCGTDHGEEWWEGISARKTEDRKHAILWFTVLIEGKKGGGG